MGKRRTPRYKIHVSVKSSNPITLMYSGGVRKFTVDAHGKGMSRTEAVKTIKRMRMVYPHSWNYKIKRSKE